MYASLYRKNLRPRASLLRVLTVCMALAALWMFPASAAAFQQTMTCNPSGPFACMPGETPLPVLWPGAQVTFVINDQGTFRSDASPGFSQQLEDAVVWSFEQWNQVVCETGCSDILLTYKGTTSETTAEFNQNSPDSNINLVIWRDQHWSQIATSMTFALTSVTFNPKTGRIVDADLEINSQFYVLNVADPAEPTFMDLRNTLVHEAGHFIGLDHSGVVGSTMYATADLGETNKRSLEADDIAAICASYPPDFVAERTCDNAYIDPSPDLDPNNVSDADSGSDDGDSSGCGCNTDSPNAPLSLFQLISVCLLAGVGWSRAWTRRKRLKNTPGDD